MTKDQHIENLKAEIKQLNEWIDDLQSGKWINCVYCGHRYGPNTVIQTTMRKALRAHIDKCTKHPLSEANREIHKLKLRNAYLEELLDGDQLY